MEECTANDEGTDARPGQVPGRVPASGSLLASKEDKPHTHTKMYVVYMERTHWCGNTCHVYAYTV